jgi:hypothetical protein
VIEGATALGAIDGYFETTPTVWHDEILFALDRGIPVYGAASIGALRAAELHIYGMQGVGRIFEWYRDGVLIDDDEVAVLHGPAELGFVCLTEPMVNIRASVQRAVELQIIDISTASEIVTIVKSTFYKNRTREYIFRHLNRRILPFRATCQIEHIFLSSFIDLKRLDSRLMIERIFRGTACPL